MSILLFTPDTCFSCVVRFERSPIIVILRHSTIARNLVDTQFHFFTPHESSPPWRPWTAARCDVRGHRRGGTGLEGVSALHSSRHRLAAAAPTPRHARTPPGSFPPRRRSRPATHRRGRFRCGEDGAAKQGQENFVAQGTGCGKRPVIGGLRTAPVGSSASGREAYVRTPSENRRHGMAYDTYAPPPPVGTRRLPLREEAGVAERLGDPAWTHLACSQGSCPSAAAGLCCYSRARPQPGTGVSSRSATRFG